MNPYDNPYNAPQPPQGGYGGPPGHGPQAFGSSYGGYEFNHEENAVISQAAFWARLLGIFLIVTGAVALLNCNVISFAIDLAIGMAFIGGATAFSAVVSTQGNDIQHMMAALTKLGSAFKIRVIVTMVGVGLLALLAILFTVLMLSAAAK